MFMYTSGHLDSGAGVVDFSYINTAATGSNSSTYTYAASAIGAAHASRRVIAGIVSYASASGRTVTVTIGGVTAAQIAATSQTVSGTTTYCGIYRATVPTGTTADIVATYSASMNGAAISALRLVNSSETAHDTGTDTASDPSTTIDVPVGGIAVAMCGFRSETVGETWTGLTENFHVTYDTQFPVFNQVSAASDIFATLQTGRTVSVDMTGATSAALCVASWPA